VVELSQRELQRIKVIENAAEGRIAVAEAVDFHEPVPAGSARALRPCHQETVSRADKALRRAAANIKKPKSK
jgi:hypothetical protein